MALDAATTGLTVFLATNVGKFKKDMADAGSSVSQLGSSISGTAKGIMGLSTAIQGASLAAGLAMGALGAIAAKMAGELETHMNNVATVWDEAGQKAEGTFLGLGDATDQLLDISGRLPQSATTLAEALYDVASSGFQGTAAMKVMTVSAAAASAGLTTTAVAARGITTVLNAYGDGANRASFVSDVLFQTVNLGVVTFEELSSVMGEFIGMAATAGVEITDANAALATMTLGGMSAAESATSLNRVLQSFIEPTEALNAVLQQLGYESGAVALEQDGLHVVMTKIAAMVGGENVEAFAALFDEIRAVRGVLSLVAGDGENYADVVGKMTDETALFGQTQIALEKQSQSTGFQMTLLKNNLTAIAIEYGQLLLPAIRMVTEAMGDFAAGLRALPGWIKATLAVGATLTGLLIVLAGLWVGNKITSMLFGAAMNFVSGALQRAGYSTVFVTRALHGLKVAMGIFGAVMLAASAAMIIFGSKQDDVGAGQEELKDTLDATTGAVTAQTGAFLRDRAVKEGWDDDANELGISMGDLSAALLGNAEAIGRVNAARKESVDSARAEMLATKGNNAASHEANHVLSERIEASERLGGALKDTKEDVKAAEQAVLDEAAANSADADSVKKLTTAEQEERKTAVARAEAHIGAIETIQKEIDKTFDLAEAYRLAVDTGNSAGADKKADNARRDRHKAVSDALDNEIELERRAADNRTEIRRQVLDDQQDAERDAFEEANRQVERALAERRRLEDDAFEASSRAQTDALKERQKAEQDGLDQLLRIQKNAFDDQARARSDAHDDEMEELRDQADERKEVEQEAWEVRQDEIDFMINSSFGAEREHWKQVRKDEEDAYEDRIDTIEEEGDKLVRAEGNAFDDRERILDQAYDDQERVQKDGLARRHDNEKQALADDLALIKTGVEDRRRLEDQAWDDLVRLDADKIAVRHRAQKTAFDKALQADKDHMDDRHTVRKDGLAKIQLAEDDAADTRIGKSKEKHVPTMAEIQKQAEDMLKVEQKKNTDLAEIARLGGENINSVTLAEIAKLPPAAIAVIAGSGAPAIKQLGTTIETAVKEANIDPIKQAFNRWGNAAGVGLIEGFIPEVFKRLQDFLAAPPGAGGGFGLLGLPIGSAALNVGRNAEGHYAQIAPAGAWRIWAEPETGGEAYIPLAQSKAARSFGIWQQVGQHFGWLGGMANGGIVGGSATRSSGGGVSFEVNVAVENHLAPGLDLGVTGRMIEERVRSGVEAGLDGVRRQVLAKSWRG